jgi:hypothetical protein
VLSVQLIEKSAAVEVDAAMVERVAGRNMRSAAGWLSTGAHMPAR